MSKIIDDSVDAFCEGRKFKRSNMQVEKFGPHINMYQHDNMIAQRDLDKGLYSTRISCAGWYSVTTKARLDALVQRVTQGAWSLSSGIRGEGWVLWSHTHGESLPFRGVAYLEELVDLDETIIKERLARAPALEAAA